MLFVLTFALNFNATIIQVSSKPKLYKFLLNFSIMNFYLDLHFMYLCYCFFTIPNVVNYEQ
jgi:hypothetical protein